MKLSWIFSLVDYFILRREAYLVSFILLIQSDNKYLLVNQKYYLLLYVFKKKDFPCVYKLLFPHT